MIGRLSAVDDDVLFSLMTRLRTFFVELEVLTVKRLPRLLIFFALLAVVGSSSIFAQTPPEKPAEGAQADEAKMKPLREALDELDKAIKGKVEVEIITYVKEVGDKLTLGSKAMQDEAIDKLAKTLKSKNNEIKTLSIEALAKTASPKASQLLLAEIDSEPTKSNVTLLCKCVSAVGSIKDEKAVAPLLKLLHHKETDVQGQAIAALGNFRDLKLEARKSLFKDLMKIYAPIESAATKSGAKTTDKVRHEKLSGPFESTLSALTGKSGVTGAFQWDQWFKKEGEKAAKW